MSRSNTLRCAAGLVLAVSLLLPGAAAAAQGSRSGEWAAPSELILSPARLWDAFLSLLPAWRSALSSAEGDNGWQIDPNGDEAPDTPSPDNGWQIDPNG